MIQKLHSLKRKRRERNMNNKFDKHFVPHSEKNISRIKDSAKPKTTKEPNPNYTPPATVKKKKNKK